MSSGSLLFWHFFNILQHFRKSNISDPLIRTRTLHWHKMGHNHNLYFYKMLISLIQWSHNLYWKYIRYLYDFPAIHDGLRYVRSIKFVFPYQKNQNKQKKNIRQHNKKRHIYLKYRQTRCMLIDIVNIIDLSKKQKISVSYGTHSFTRK